MIKRISLFSLFLLISATACTSGNKIDPTRDYHSFSNPHLIVIQDIQLDLAVDFEKKILSGTASLQFQKKQKNAKRLVLDTRNLKILDVFFTDTAGTKQTLEFTLGKEDSNLGTALTIILPVAITESDRIIIQYETNPNASGLQWLSAAQTANKNHPFLFTQSQAIHARSWIPLQDTPQVRMTYSATIHTPQELRAVMSAANDPNAPENGVYHFEMPQAIPSYLMALAVGDLSFKPIGKRTGVYAESTLLDAASKEFEDTEAMLETAEKMYGEYRWGRYDLLILPPSFPFGGMENPRLSFITPTVIAGDKSLVSLIAHELAHSWSGNLVTNATWRDLWLNEGFTSYVESRIMEKIYGKERAEMENLLNYNKLQKDLESLSKNDQILAIDLRGRDPDDVFSDVPYVKGQLFLVWLERKYGRRVFDRFLQEYFDHFAFQSINTEQFYEYMKANLIDKNKVHMSTTELKRWLYKSGMPRGTQIPTSDAFDKVDIEMEKWSSGIAAELLDTNTWKVHQWLHFLNTLPENLSHDLIFELDKVFKFTQTKNNEIAHVWLKIVIKSNYQPAFERLENYLISIGRRKLVVPLYDEMLKIPEYRDFALAVYEKARPGYHPLTTATVDKLIAEKK